MFDQGDEVSRKLPEFAAQNDISVASFVGIGALSKATIAYWNPTSKKYEEIVIGEQVEVLSISGNLAPSVDKVKLHAHIILGRRDGSTIGGHFVRGVVYPTLEIFLTAREVNVSREKDSETQLWLLRQQDKRNTAKNGSHRVKVPPSTEKRSRF